MMDVSNFAVHFTTQSFDALANEMEGAVAAAGAVGTVGAVDNSGRATTDFQGFQYVAPVAKGISCVTSPG